MESEMNNNASDFFLNNEIIKTIYINNNKIDKNEQKISTNYIQQSIIDESFMKSIFNKSELENKSNSYEIWNKPAHAGKNYIDFLNQKLRKIILYL
jgi:hypothetical protein